MGAFLEGLESIRLPCTLTVLVPALAVVVSAGRRAGLALTGFVVGAAAVAWARFADRWFDDPGTILSIILGLIAGAAAAGLVVMRRRDSWAVPAVGAAAGMVTGWLWQPCVGPELGAIINRAPTEPAATVPPTLAYLAGTTAIAAAVALAPIAAPRLSRVRDHLRVRMAGSVTGVAIGLTIAIGVYDDLVAELLQRSTF